MSAHLNVIDGNSRFASTPEEITSFLQRHGLLARGRAYSIVGIMGCQSSGKSTLLNLVFGTQFQELDSSKGRQMTTKGVWFGASPKVPECVILDLEGTDSSNRDDASRGSFERQSALFGLALTEILIINMWQSDIGRYVAANYGVLSTVFEVNLQLFAHDQKGAKTTLLFMIRDHDEEDTPLKKIQDQIEADVAKIWADLNKPSEFKDVDFSSIFILKFFSLPHKKYKSLEFSQGIEELRDRFLNQSHNEYFFANEYHQMKSVPAEMLGLFCQRVWASILENKDVNLPSEKKMIANYRCDEIVKNLIQKTVENTESLRRDVSKSIVENFHTVVKTSISNVLITFDAETAGYEPEVVSSKREEFILRIGEEFLPIFIEQMTHAKVMATDYLRGKLDEELSQGSFNEAFHDILRTHRAASLEKFSKILENSKVDEFKWNFDGIQKDLTKELGEIENAARRSQLDCLVQLCSTNLQKTLVTSCQELFSEISSALWPQLSALRGTTVRSTILDVLNEKVRSFGATESEIQKLRKHIVDTSTSIIFEEARTQAGFVKLRMHEKFDKLFRLRQDGSVRRWADSEDPRKVFGEAVKKSYGIGDLLQKLSLEKYEFPGEDAIDISIEAAELELISYDELKKAKAEFRNEVESALIQAELMRERARSNGVPMWALAMILVLGWNEILAVLSSPILLTLLIIIGGGLFIIKSLGIENTVLVIVRPIYQQIMRVVLDNMEVGAGPSVHQAPVVDDRVRPKSD